MTSDTDGLFETFLLEPNKGDWVAVCYHYHMNRLASGAFEEQIAISEQAIHSQIKEALSTRKECETSLRCRVIVTRAKHYVEIEPWSSRFPAEGAIVKSVSATRTKPHLKSLNTEVNRRAQRVATELGGHEAILVSQDGILREGAWTSIAWKVGDVFFSTAKKVLPGVTVKVFKEYVEKLDQKLIFTEMDIHEVKNTAQSIYIMNSTHGIIPVRKIDESNFDLNDGFQEFRSGFNSWRIAHPSSSLVS